MSLYHGGEILGEPVFSQQVVPGSSLRFHGGIIFPIKVADLPRSARLVVKVIRCPAQGKRRQLDIKDPKVRLYIV